MLASCLQREARDLGPPGSRSLTVSFCCGRHPMQGFYHDSSSKLTEEVNPLATIKLKMPATHFPSHAWGWARTCDLGSAEGTHPHSQQDTDRDCEIQSDNTQWQWQPLHTAPRGSYNCSWSSQLDPAAAAVTSTPESKDPRVSAGYALQPGLGGPLRLLALLEIPKLSSTSSQMSFLI